MNKPIFDGTSDTPEQFRGALDKLKLIAIPKIDAGPIRFTPATPDPYTPTTEEIRNLFAFSRAGDRIHRTQDYFDAFDRWLAAHDAKVAEKAWDEGYSDAQADEFDNNQRPEDRTPNPYKAKESPNV